jgi:murein DD-endopeptidase MepM/ murein hydrolase activator NlpD
VASGTVSVVKCDEDRRGRKSCNVDGYPGKGGCGWMVEILHARNVMTRYCHMVQPPFVTIGQDVTAGEIIGRVGTSGNSSGPHLHFEVHLNNDRTSRSAVDPVRYMREQGAPLEGQQ